MFRTGQEIGLFTLIKRIGRGGFGEVWLAERRAKFVTTKVAVKLPLDEQVNHEAIKQEAVLWEQASGHPNVLPIIDADEYDGQIVIVSEYAPDGSLDELLRQKGALPTRKAVELVMGILSGLEFLHNKKIIHRDIKPANILLQGDTPRLADFGISRVMKTTSVSVNMSGTPSYMAPEAFDRKRNAQTDIWSVGVILYQMIKGSLPFPHENITDLLGAVIMNEPEPLPDSVPSPLRKIIFKALAKKPEQRYQTAREMRDDLADFLIGISHQSIQPTLREEQLPPTSFGERFDKTLPLEQLNPTQASPTAKSFIPAPNTKEQNPNQTQASPTMKSPLFGANTAGQRLAETRQSNEILKLPKFESYKPEIKTRFIKFLAPLIILILLGAVGTYFLINYQAGKTTNVVQENKSVPKTITNKYGMEFVLVPAGSFTMGDDSARDNERPAHQVTFKKSFYLGRYEVTQSEWEQVMGNNPSAFRGDNLPVEQVSWNDAQDFIKKLNDLNDGFTYKLPSEAEWEYACRAGTKGNFAGSLDTMAWYGNNSGREYLDSNELSGKSNYAQIIIQNGNQTHPVGNKQTNALGLYDMHGNVAEWCEDILHRNYNDAPTDGSAWVSNSDGPAPRMIRGGMWAEPPGMLRSASRYWAEPAKKLNSIGFRVVAVSKSL